MPILRRSLNNNNANPSSSSSSQTPPLPRPSEKVAPPQKVIKALRTHKSTNPQELSYQQGDFWYVTGERDGWFEALNPLTGSRGLVPKSDFEEFMKGGRASAGAGGQRQGSADSVPRSETPSHGHLSHTNDPRSPPLQSPPMPNTRKPKQPVYAIVQYDFQAERPDELDAKKGEPIVVIAQSNHEWFVAKPIGRLGGPGLIPVAFVEIRDPATGRAIEVLPDTIPMVEEWKKATADYKAAAIPLGRFEMGDQSVADSPYAPSRKSQQASSAGASQHSLPVSLPRSGSTSSVGKVNGNGTNGTPLYQPEEDALLPSGEITSLAVPSFHNESGNYWFRLAVTFHPDHQSAPDYSLSLYRTYEDFYDFQISLLDTFPFEAGRTPPGSEDQSPPPERILPYMPGPVDEAIDDELTEYRREELDAYVKALVDLGSRGAGYILRHELFRGFFAAKYGDHCQEVERQDAMEELDERMGGMNVNKSGNTGGGEGSGRSSGFGHDQRSQSAMSRHSQRSGSGMGRASPQSTNLASISQGPVQGGQHNRSHSRGNSPMPPVQQDPYSNAQQPYRPNSSGYGHNTSRSISGSSTTQTHTGRQSNPSNPPMTSSSQFSTGFPTATTTSSFGHAPSTSISNTNTGTGQPPYIKIKIYDRATDDLIAIRVHPNVTHSDLFEKVRARLGNEVVTLRFKDLHGGYGEIADDRALKDWLRIEDQKLVLYAEQS